MQATTTIALCAALCAALLAACAGQQPCPEHPPPDGQAHPGGGHGHGYTHAGHTDHDFADVEQWASTFESPERDAWQRPDAVLAALSLQLDSVVADIGSASGYFPVRIAPLVARGRVWGVDVEPGMVRYLNARARRDKLDNLYSILGADDDPLLPEPVDVALMVNTYHHVEHRTAYFGRLATYLEPGGRLVIVDFKLGELPVGPPDTIKVGPDTIVQELCAAGYTLASRDDAALPYQHLLVFTHDGRAPADVCTEP